MEFAFECPLASGLHIRPARHLSDVANRFISACSMTNLQNGLKADLKRVLAVVAADVREGDRCSITVEGVDNADAGAALRRFIGQDLPRCDELPAEAPPNSSSRKVPRVLRASSAQCYFGLPVSAGAGQGKIVIMAAVALSAQLIPETPGDPRAERERVQNGFAAVRARVEGLLSNNRAGVEAEILQAHLAILDDKTLRLEIERRIDSGLPATQAVAEAGERFAELLNKAENQYIRERALDVQELCIELLAEMYGPQFRRQHMRLEEPAIIVAETLAPHQFLGLDRKCLKGIVLESSGTTSHAVILARTLGVPVVAGVANARRILTPGLDAIVDGNRGIVIAQSTPSACRFYERESAAARRRNAVLARIGMAPALTSDGARIEVGANVAYEDEISPVFENGADGIGLFRTEILFAGRERPLSEDEQYGIYSRAVRAAGGRPVIFRTIDIGGDKPLPYLRLPAEKNPFLGYRGIRIYPEFRDLVATQLRAMLRASASGPVWLIAPMISSLDEVKWFQKEVERAKSELERRQSPFDASIRLGAMIEVPSACFLLPQLGAELDFFSIGTNDLSQYFFAADRETSRLASLANVRNPAFLTFLKQIADELQACAKWVGMCGEMASDPRNLPLLLGLGLNEISVPSNEIVALKQKIAGFSAAECRQLLARAVRCGAPEEVEQLLDLASPSEPARLLLDAELVDLRSHSRTKEEAISEIINALYATGRIEDPQELEEAIWAREQIYATGVGHGLAIPHCNSKTVRASAISILRLQQPIEWGSGNSSPVAMVILLALREFEQSGVHMKVFSQLARKLMSEEFRSLLMSIEDPSDLIIKVRSELGGDF